MLNQSLKKQNGFTLIELAIFIIVLTVFVVIGVKWPGKSPQLGGQEDQLVSDIKYIQQIAITRHKRFGIVFYPTKYGFYDFIANPVPHPASMSSSNIINLESGITLSTINLPANPFFSGSNGVLLFDRFGIPYYYNTGTSTWDLLASTGVVILTVEGESRNIAITQETGMVATS